MKAFCPKSRAGLGAKNRAKAAYLKLLLRALAGRAPAGITRRCRPARWRCGARPRRDARRRPPHRPRRPSGRCPGAAYRRPGSGRTAAGRPARPRWSGPARCRLRQRLLQLRQGGFNGLAHRGVRRHERGAGHAVGQVQADAQRPRSGGSRRSSAVCTRGARCCSSRPVAGPGPRPSAWRRRAWRPAARPAADRCRRVEHGQRLLALGATASDCARWSCTPAACWGSWNVGVAAGSGRIPLPGARAVEPRPATLARLDGGARRARQRGVGAQARRFGRGRDALDVGGHGGGLAAGLGGGGDHGHGQLRIAGIAAAAAWACCAVSGTGARGVGVTSLAFNALTSTAAAGGVIAACAAPRAFCTCSAAWAAISSACCGSRACGTGCCGGDRHRAGLGLGGLLDGFVDGAGRGVLGMALRAAAGLPGAGSRHCRWGGRHSTGSDAAGPAPEKPLLSDTEVLAPRRRR